MSSQHDSSCEEFVPTQNIAKELAKGNVAGHWDSITDENYDTIPPESLYTGVAEYECKNKVVQNAWKCLDELKWAKYKMDSTNGVYSDDDKKKALRNAVISIRKLEKLDDLVDTACLADYYKAVRGILADFAIKKKAEPKKEIVVQNKEETVLIINIV